MFTHSSQLQTARLAGLLYLIVVLTGIFTLAYVPGKLINWGSAADTWQRLNAGEALFRLSILASMVCYTAFLCLPFVLYRLLKPVHATVALMMVVFAAGSIPLSFANLQHKWAVLSALGNSGNIANQAANVMQQLTAYDYGIFINSWFWGLWLLPFGWLVYRSGFLPKLLGVLLVLGCAGYLINITGTILWPNYKSLGISGYISLPASMGEIGTCLYLLIVGVKRSKSELLPSIV